MSLNLLYSPEPSLQEGFLDKSTGLPLSFGLVFSYSDVNRTVLKPIFELSGSPPNYTYTPLPNPIILSGIGTIQDASGNDVIPYFYPFDALGNPELYYIVVTDQFGVQQFTRQGFPNAASGSTPPIPVINYSQNAIPNGQFLLFNPPASYPTTAYTFNYGGTIGSTTVNDVAPGGWDFEVSAGSTATYTITFNQLLATLLNPSASPRYEIEIVRSGTSIADPISDLRIRFMDVNKFQSNGVNDTWTFLFNAEALASLPGVTIHIIKYFGTSGSSSTPVSPTQDIPVGGPITIGTSQQVFATSFVFGDNLGSPVGNNNNDFVEIAIRFPAAISQTWDVKLTDFILVNQAITQAQANSISFPATTNGEFVLQALSNLAPTTTSSTTTNYYQQDGSNLYLPMVMTQRGFTYDYSQIGIIEADTTLNNYTSGISNVGNTLICDGSQYPVNGYSPLGIPYRRLFNKITNTLLLGPVPVWGTGATFVNAIDYTVDLPSNVFLFTNQPGAQTSPANGTTSPGFTYAVSTFGATTINLTARTNTNGVILVRGNTVGTAFSAPVDGTGGQITFAVFTNFASTNWVALFTLSGGISTASLGAGAGNPAQYISMSNTTTQYSFWFNTAGELPNGPGTRIQINLIPGMLTQEIGAIIASTINRYQTDIVFVTSGATISQGSYFTFHANGVTYSPWYNVNGSGIVPIGLTNPIQININSTDSASTVALNTTVAIDSQFFAVPDLRGLFLRGVDPTSIYDGKLFGRTSNVYNINYLDNNTFEIDVFGDHTHPAVNGNFLVSAGGTNSITAGGGSVNQNSVTGQQGGYETRPVNMAITWVIRY
jgi:hypothetical protein